MNATNAILDPALRGGLASATALIQADRQLSYGDVAALTNRIGHGLRALGVQREQRVLLMLKDSPEFVCTFLAAMKIGAVAVPVNLRSSVEDLAFYLVDSRATVAVLDSEFLPHYERIAGQLEIPPLVVVHGALDQASGFRTLNALQTGQPSELETALMSPDDMAFWLYTSGTTGPAKASVHVHHDVLSSEAYLRETLGVTAGMRLFATSKLFFAYALGTCLFGGFRLGATTILHGEWPTPASVRAVLDVHRPDIVFSVPTLYRNLLKAGAGAEPCFQRVRAYVSAGEKLPAAVYVQWRAATGVEIVEGMGTTETIYMFLTNRPGECVAGSLGHPAPGAQVRLVDDDGQIVTQPGQQGILQVRMDSICDRYWNQQARTRAALQGDWFSTGDLFSRNGDGQWTHIARRDDLLKMDGRWVSPAEIEEEVLALSQVADAAVVGVPAPDGVMRVTLYVVPALPGTDATKVEMAVRQALREHRPACPIPDRICIVPALPRTASGKVERYRLRQELLANPDSRPAVPEK